jgi:acetyl-CoA synthetase
MGASGGDMAMSADVARSLDIEFAAIPAAESAVLRELLTARVTVANPFDFHTYLWFDPPALRRVFATVLHAGFDAVGFMLDCPPDGKSDTTAFDAVIDVFIDAAQGAPTRAALIASLPETVGARIRQHCMNGGVVPLQGQREALEALAFAGAVGKTWRLGQDPQLQLPKAGAAIAVERRRTLAEDEAKAQLAKFGVPTGRGITVPAPAAAAAAVSLGFPVVIKAVGAHLEHKTEVGGVVLNVRSAAEAQAAVARLAGLSDTLLVEPMITDGVAEILVGVIVDPQFGLVLVIGAGGVLTELLADSVSLLPPWTRESIEAALPKLKAARLLAGFRGKPPGDVAALVEAVLAVARYATAHLDTLAELDVNPIIVRPAGKGAIAVDALIRLKEK